MDAPSLFGITPQQALSAVAGAYMMLLTWLGRRQIARIDALESTHSAYVTRAELNETLRALRDEIREDSRALTQRLDGTNNRLDEILRLLVSDRRL